MNLAVNQDKARDGRRGLRLGEQFRTAQSAEGERACACEELSAPEPLCCFLLSQVWLPDCDLDASRAGLFGHFQ